LRCLRVSSDRSASASLSASGDGEDGAAIARVKGDSGAIVGGGAGVGAANGAATAFVGDDADRATIDALPIATFAGAVMCAAYHAANNNATNDKGDDDDDCCNPPSRVIPPPFRAGGPSTILWLPLRARAMAPGL
jgi:hypothetical protein